MMDSIRQQFQSLFGKKPLLVASPGRINLLGEHTDYNQGFVLPAAIDKKIVFGLALNGTDICKVHAIFQNETQAFSLQDIRPSAGWINYIKGVVFQLQQRGIDIPGFDCVLGGDIPVGAGMSSSAAVEGGLVVGLQALVGFEMDRMEMAKVGQDAEHTFPGVKCGIMDQFANLFGKKGSVMRLDCRSLEYTYMPFQIQGRYQLVLCNSMVHHALASSAYNERRAQCEQGLAFFQQKNPFIQSLRDLSSQQVRQAQHQLDPIVYNRCLYVTEENERVQQACTFLEQNQIEAFGTYMYATHQGLSEQYEVSCIELDFLVKLAHQRSEVLGARMMGGGFGGCTINIVAQSSVPDYIAFIQDEFEQKFKVVPECYVLNLEDGTAVL
jgi:galactokinase